MDNGNIFQVDMDVPFAPPPVRAQGHTCLVYELFLHNSSGKDLKISRVEVLPAESGALAPIMDVPPVLVLEGQPLDRSIHYLSENLQSIQTISFENRRLVCIYLWVRLDQSHSLPAKLFHRVSFSPQENGKNAALQTITGAPIRVDTREPLIITPPLTGENWLALNGPAHTSQHRRALLPGAGQPWFPQRFAVDWVQLGRDGQLYRVLQVDPAAWYGYGAEVIAVGKGVVVSALDGLPENTPLAKTPRTRVDLKNAAGNHIVIDLGEQRYALFAHLRPGSLKVSKGERVREGQVIAIVGLSGNASMPHLHFHIGNTPDPLASQGLPFSFETFMSGGAGKIPSRRDQEIPLENMVVSFSS